MSVHPQDPSTAINYYRIIVKRTSAIKYLAIAGQAMAFPDFCGERLDSLI
jgi:hypothetical protein